MLALSLVTKLDIATVMLQWATGSLLFLWVTTRHRLVGLGYGWLMRGVFIFVAAIAVATNGSAPSNGRTICSAGLILFAGAALAQSIFRRGAGVATQRLEQERKRDRVRQMTNAGANESALEVGGTEPHANAVDDLATASIQMRDEFGRSTGDSEKSFTESPEFDHRLDLLAPAIGFVGLILAAHSNGAVFWLAGIRTVVGALFLGAVTDAMLLGHWYLVQPGLARRPIVELNEWFIRLWPLEVAAMLLPTGMLSVLNGTINDKWNGILGWTWLACALTTGILAYVTRVVLKERYYSAVMAATGMLYLAILTAFGTDIVARALLQ